MSGREAGREPHSPSAVTDPDALEVVSGIQREKLEGWVPDLATPEELCAALEEAFDYRGDVLITRKDGIKVEGYVFDRRTGKILWQTKLPAGGYATPATYMVGGRQYIVIACGGGKMGTRSGDAYVAFALPR